MANRDDKTFKKNSRGFYIGLDGIDGCGKSSQVIRLSNVLKAQKVNVLITKEPNKTGRWGELIYHDLNRENGAHKDAYEFQYLFVFDRMENTKERVLPHLKAGGTVVQDRTLAATLCYGAEKAEFKEMWRFLDLNYNILGSILWPDVFFILDIPVEIAVERLAKSTEKLDAFEAKDNLERVRKNYLYFPEFLKKAFPVNSNPFNVKIIDGSKDEDSVFSEIIEELKRVANDPGVIWWKDLKKQ